MKTGINFSLQRKCQVSVRIWLFRFLLTYTVNPYLIGRYGDVVTHVCNCSVKVMVICLYLNSSKDSLIRFGHIVLLSHIKVSIAKNVSSCHCSLSDNSGEQCYCSAPLTQNQTCITAFGQTMPFFVSQPVCCNVNVTGPRRFEFKCICVHLIIVHRI